MPDRPIWLSCNDLTATYPQFKLQLDLTVHEGEMISIIGPSGCGKSTALQLLCGLMPPDSGTITLAGKDITATPPWQRGIGMVFQDYALFPHMDVQHNIAYSLKLRHVSRKERKEQVHSLLELVGLQGYERRWPDQLSGGERQRVSLARALASKPSLLLLDEPLSALDAQLRKHLRKEICRIHAETGITTIHVTHDQEEALGMSDRIVVMRDGQVEQIATPQQIYRHPSTLFAAQFMGEGTILPLEVVADTVQNAPVPASWSHIEPTQERQVFFRPEQVTVHTDANTAFPDFLPHVQLSGAMLVESEYTGGNYLLTYQYHGHEVLATSKELPTAPTATLGIRLSDLEEYEEGVNIAKR